MTYGLTRYKGNEVTIDLYEEIVEESYKMPDFTFGDVPKAAMKSSASPMNQRKRNQEYKIIEMGELVVIY